VCLLFGLVSRNAKRIPKNSFFLKISVLLVAELILCYQIAWMGSSGVGTDLENAPTGESHRTKILWGLRSACVVWRELGPPDEIPPQTLELVL
jgi:hypothetical protein